MTEPERHPNFVPEITPSGLLQLYIGKSKDVYSRIKKGDFINCAFLIRRCNNLAHLPNIFASKNAKESAILFLMIVFQLYRSDTFTRLPLPYADDGIRAGFPSPAQDYITESIDLNTTLIKHPASTFYAKVSGDSMCEEGITEGDILIIDRSIEAEHGDLAVCCINGEFTLKRLCLNRGDKIYLMPSNRKFRPIEVTRDDDFMVWGVVIYTIKANRRRRSGAQRW